MIEYRITAHRRTRYADTALRRLVVYWIAHVDGLKAEFCGRTRAEAVGRAYLHLTKWREIDPKCIDVEGFTR